MATPSVPQTAPVSASNQGPRAVSLQTAVVQGVEPALSSFAVDLWVPPPVPAPMSFGPTSRRYLGSYRVGRARPSGDLLPCSPREAFLQTLSPKRVASFGHAAQPENHHLGLSNRLTQTYAKPCKTMQTAHFRPALDGFHMVFTSSSDPDGRSSSAKRRTFCKTCSRGSFFRSASCLKAGYLYDAIPDLHGRLNRLD